MSNSNAISQQNIRVALIQCNPIVGAITQNTQLVKELTENCLASHEPDIVVFPELTITAYPPEDLLYREGFVEGAVKALDELLDLSYKTRIIVGVPLREDGKLYNAACLLWQGDKQFYKKRELPNYGVFDEKRYFTAGEDALVFECKGRDIGISICEDIWFSTSMQKASELGAQCMINLNASPYHETKQALRTNTLEKRIDENAIPIFYVNQIGGQDEIVFDGNSVVLDEHKNIVAQAPSFEEATLVVDWQENGEINQVSSHEIASDSLGLLYSALVLGIKDYITKNGFSKVALGLSGGIDSALTLTLAADALGGENVKAIMMPSEYTSQISLDDAAAIADNYGVDYDIISIAPMRDAFTDSLAPLFEGLAEDTTEENIQARIRGLLLMAVSNKTNCLVLATGNKSEMAVGYATLYGDMCGGFAPLKDVSKILVYELSNWRNENAHLFSDKPQLIPERIITREPSAELKHDQTDQDSLPPYEILDAILEKYIEEHKSVATIASEGFDEQTIKDIVKRVDLNEYKRRQSAPGVKITKNAFGRERRYPITSGYRRDQELKAKAK